MAATGILNHTFSLVLIVVGLLSGALSVLREIQMMYAPPTANQRRVFWGWVRVAFVLAIALLWVDEHTKVIQLTAELQDRQKPIQVTSPPKMAYMAPVGNGIVPSAYKIGGYVLAGTGCKNLSDSEVAENVSCIAGLRVVATTINKANQATVLQSTEDEQYAQFEKDASSLNDVNHKSYGPGENDFKNVYSPLIDEVLDREFRARKKTVLLLGKYKWHDQSGDHENELCTWLQNYVGLFSDSGMVTAPTITWHSCVNHNGLKDQK